MIPLVNLGVLVLGLAGWPLELEDDTRGSYGGRPGYAFCSSTPFLSAQSLTFHLDHFSGGRSQFRMSTC